MTVYIDSDYKCHLKNDGSMRAVETEFFEGKCHRYVEGYRYVPEGETWIREDGEKFTGEMIAPCENYTVLAAAQQVYENFLPQLQELRAKLETIAECFDGLATNPSFEQLVDFISALRELVED